MVTTTFILFFIALEAASEGSYDYCDDEPDDDYRYNYRHMEKIFMVLVTIKLSQKCLEFVPDVLEAATFSIPVAYLLLRKLDKFSEFRFIILF